MAKRVTLTKEQKQTQAGIELLQLCQTVTEDGHLSDEEIQSLRDWVEENADCGFTSWGHLKAVLELVLADGLVTPHERVELYKEILKVLPTDLRSLVVANKKEIDRREKERNAPIGRWNFMVAGARYEGRPNVIYEFAREGDPAYLARHRENQHSKNAVAIVLKNGMQIGFVPEEWAVQIAPELDEGLPHSASIKKILTGGRSPIPVIDVSIFSRESTLEYLVFQEGVTPTGKQSVVLHQSSSLPEGVQSNARVKQVFWCEKCRNKLWANERREGRVYCGKCVPVRDGLDLEDDEFEANGDQDELDDVWVARTPIEKIEKPPLLSIKAIPPRGRAKSDGNLIGWGLVIFLLVSVFAVCSYVR